MDDASEHLVALEPILDGAVSLSGQPWRRRKPLARLAEGLASGLGLPLMAGEMLAARGLDLEAAKRFMEPRLKFEMPDPMVLMDMDKAVERLFSSFQRQETVCVFGDYDVDGATSGSVLIRFLKHIGLSVFSYVPDRMSEGYGPNPDAMRAIKGQGADLVVTVDCGTLSFAALETAAEIGLDAVVVDHHKAEAALPPAAAIVNPNRLDDSSEGLGHLAAVGVVFLLVIALNRRLREADIQGIDTSPSVPLQWLDLVALGTVCDVVPLTGLNRAFVAQGLQIMRQRQNQGIVALMDAARVDEAPGAYHLGFLLGPRVNAGGRVGESGMGTRLLTSDDPAEAQSLAAILDRFNSERKAIEADVQAAASAQADYDRATEPGADVLTFVAGEGWHAGVIGIVASRLKERFGVPSFVLSVEGDDIKGSARSITGVDIGAAVIEARAQGLLTKGGGHAMAAGVSLRPDQLADFRQFLVQRISDDVKQAQASRALTLDAVLSVGGAIPDLISAIDKLAPFGVGNPSPKIMLADCIILEARVVGQGHVRLLVKDRSGVSMKVMAFRVAEEPIGQALLAGVGASFHLAGRLKLDMWTGRPKVEMTLEDAMPA